MHFLRRREHMVTLAKEFGADQISLHHSLVTPRLCKLAAEAGLADHGLDGRRSAVAFAAN
jgi:hypothetical protein